MLLTFRSLSLPILLIFVIKGSIWINMALPYFTRNPLIFIGFLIVSAIQLGATIDYAILLTHRYLERRRSQPAISASAGAVADAGAAILTSAGIMSAAGFTLYAVSSVAGIAGLGLLIGRGALLSGGLVLILLPQLLVLSDRLIRLTALKRNPSSDHQIERSSTS